MLSVVRFVCGEYPNNAKLATLEYYIRHSERDARLKAGDTVDADDTVGEMPMFATRDDRWQSFMEAILRVEENQRAISDRLLRLELNAMTPMMYGVSTVVISTLVTLVLHMVIW